MKLCECVVGSGFIDFDEFVAVMNEFMPVDDAEQMRLAFSMMDRDGSGKVSAAELKQVMRSIGEKLTDDEIDEIIREIDMDGDGEVDYGGWCQGQSRRSSRHWWLGLGSVLVVDFEVRD